jgi:CheY-like chemotaxis protein
MSLHVLIVDDDRDHAESVADILEMRGYAIEIAGSGEAGVAKFSETAFDVVLMDVKMPGMNGVEAFFAIRQIKPDAQVVMMTGFSVEELVERAMNNGAIGTLRKPLVIPQLLQTFEGLAKAA